MAKGLETASFLKMIFLIVHCLVTFEITSSFAADYSVQRWRVVEIELSSSQSYSDPFYDVDVEVTFTGPDGLKITRPAFWDGGLIWKIRFAPPETGLWTMTTNATDVGNSGLHNVTKTVECGSYAGDLDIYNHGFLKISNNGRFLTMMIMTILLCLTWRMPVKQLGQIPGGPTNHITMAGPFSGKVI